jgi:hypothetical protein
MPVFLPQFVGEKKRDDQQRQDEKNAQYEVLEHGGLRSDVAWFYCRAPHVPAMSASCRSGAAHNVERCLASFIFCIYTVISAALSNR